MADEFDLIPHGRRVGEDEWAWLERQRVKELDRRAEVIRELVEQIRRQTSWGTRPKETPPKELVFDEGWMKLPSSRRPGGWGVFLRWWAVAVTRGVVR